MTSGRSHNCKTITLGRWSGRLLWISKSQHAEDSPFSTFNLTLRFSLQLYIESHFRHVIIALNSSVFCVCISLGGIERQICIGPLSCIPEFCFLGARRSPILSSRVHSKFGRHKMSVSQSAARRV